MMYLLRITPSDDITVQLRRLDAAAVDVLRDKLSIDPVQTAARQLRCIRPRPFGLGLPSVADAHSAAFLASGLSSVRAMPQRTHDRLLRGKFPHVYLDDERVRSAARSVQRCFREL